jgi:glycosyltransferase involved in cell wall biosynthesis
VRVLVVSSYPPRRCGIGAYARDQVERLRAEGDDVTVLSPPDGAGTIRAAFIGGAAFRRAASIGARFDRIVVHFQPALYYPPRRPGAKVLTSASLLWLVLRRRSRVAVVVHETDTPIRWRPDYAILRLAFALAPDLRFHTEAERAAFAKTYSMGAVRGPGDGKLRVIEHTVRPTLPRGAITPEQARERLGIGTDGGPVLVCPGFLQPSKGLDRALEAFEAVFASDGETGARAAGERGSLYLVGSVRDPSRENLAYAAGLRSRCERVPGAHMVERFVPDEEFDLWVAAADRVVLPYRRGWSSGVLARAHELGIPAIVSNVGGLAEQAGPGDTVVEGDEELVRAFDAVRAEARAGAVR